MKKDQISELIRKGTFNGEPLNGKLVETHISWVILTQQFAFKIKKEMHYSFLDYSTKEKRKFYCERELLLNSRFSDIYLDVLPIKQELSMLCIGEGEGDTIGYAVRMKRMQIAKQMNRLLQNKRVNDTQIIILAKKIADFHRGTEIIYNPFDQGQAKNEFNDILNLVDWIKIHLGKYYASLIEKAVDHSNDFLDRNEQFIAKRIEMGFWRDGHGDLHAKNIFLYRDPIIFDCIEFNDAFRQIDVLNEIAFFCMDLESYEEWGLSKQFIKYYLRSFSCMEGKKEEQLFTYYKCYRANVRAKVNTLRAMQARDKTEVNKYLIDIRKYLKLMDYYNTK